MKTKEALETAREQILHLENYRSRPDLDYEPKPLASTEGSLAIINMAIAENMEQELITRLYNLVNALTAVLPDNDEDAQGSSFEALVFIKNEARETLKKVKQ